MLVAVVVIFTVCSVPAILFNIWQAMKVMVSKVPETQNVGASVGSYLALLLLVNSIVNPIIYYWASE